MKRISRSLVYAGATLFVLVALGAPASNQRQPFILTLAALEQPLRAGEPLILSVAVTNTSDRAVRVAISEGIPEVWKVYQVHALDERGLPPPPWVPPPPPKGKIILRIGSLKGVGLQPGKSLSDQVNITHLYDLSRPGKYKIWIAEPFYRGPGLPNGLIKSNTITVTVVK